MRAMKLGEPLSNYLADERGSEDSRVLAVAVDVVDFVTGGSGYK